MYAKLALRNVRRSLGDYAVYFITLSFAVALFYVFNALPDSSGLSSDSASIREVLRLVMLNLSWIVAIAMAFLVIYANNFLIKKRHREIGTYLVMGMEQRRISYLLFFETIILGLVALVIGMVLGILLSQFFSYLVAKMFDQSFSAVVFSISWQVLGYTALYFVAVFIVVALFSSWRTSRIKIVELLSNARREEKVRPDRPVLGVILLLISFALLGCAYYLGVGTRDVLVNGGVFLVLFACGTVGTYLFYFAISNFLQLLSRSSKKRLYQRLNIFTFRQVTSKLRTNAMLMGTISMMLFITICTFAAGFGMNSYIQNSVGYVSPHDYELRFTEEKTLEEFDAGLREQGFPEFSSIMAMNYADDLTMRDVMSEAGYEETVAEYGDPGELEKNGVLILSVSDCNRLRRSVGLDPIELAEGEYALINNDVEEIYHDAQRDKVEQGEHLTIGGQTLLPAAGGYYADTLFSNYFNNFGGGHVVVSDELAATLTEYDRMVFIDLAKDVTSSKEDEQTRELLTDYVSQFDDEYGSSSRYHDTEQLYASSALGVFAGLYLGLMFLLISVTLLALKQLTDAAEHKGRYEILRKIGADDKSIDGSIFKQILLFFCAPLVLTIVNCCFALTVITRFMFSSGHFNMWPVVGASVLILAIFYLIYFMASYYGFKRILNNR